MSLVGDERLIDESSSQLKTMTEEDSPTKEDHEREHPPPASTATGWEPDHRTQEDPSPNLRRNPKMTEKGREYQIQLRTDAWKSSKNRLKETLNQTYDILELPHLNVQQVLANRRTLAIQLMEVNDAAGNLKLLLPASNQEAITEELKGLEAAYETIKTRIIEATTPSKALSMGSRRSKASSKTRGNVAAIAVKIKEEKKHRKIEEEIEEQRRQFEEEQREAERTLKQQYEAKMRNIEKRRRDLHDMKLNAQLKVEQARAAAEESDGSQDLGSDEDDDPGPGQNFNPPKLTNRREVERNLDPSRTSETMLLTNMANAFNAVRLPVPEPPVFSGNPLHYTDWATAFNTLVDGKGIPTGDKIFYLSKYLAGSAKEAVRGYFSLNSEEGYRKARQVLEDRFGNDFIISESFHQKLESWPKMSPSDYAGLQKFSDFVNQCRTALFEVRDLSHLNDMRELSKIADKLPVHLLRQWQKKCSKTKAERGRYPKFDDFADFVLEQSELANDPVIHCTRQKQASHNRTAKVLATNTTTEKQAETRSPPPGSPQPRAKKCVFCKSQQHYLPQCEKFIKSDKSTRMNFLKETRRCYRCLREAHQAKDCKSPHDCNICKKKHPTCLHDIAEEREKAAQNRAVSMKIKTNQQTVMTTSVVPVMVSSKNNPELEVLTYALLDSGSDATFIDESTSHALGLPQTAATKLTVETIRSEERTEVESCIYNNLQVRSYKGGAHIDLPPTYSIPAIPTNQQSIPTQKEVASWPHLKSIQNDIPPLLNCDLGLLIGYNCWQALIPRKVISGKDNEPFAVNTDLGWSVTGPSSKTKKTDKEEGLIHCNRIVTNEKPLLKPLDACSILELDFQETTGDKEKTSQEDIKFMQILESSVTKNSEGYIEMPLPFRSKPDLPNNRQVAEKRLEYLKRKLTTNKELKEDYVKFMEKFIERGDAEETNSHEDQEWYLPHHGVYHNKKKKLRVVFDCSASYKGTSLNDHLLAGPNLMNDLTGVFMRFRRENVALTCDIEAMFHQFRVTPSHRRYLKFLWWKKGNLTAEPTTYRMKVHLFGATSSPACANFGMKYMAKLNEADHPEAANFIRNNFYVDDGLASVQSSQEAIKLIEESTAVCKENKLRLHKFASNNKEVVDAVPPSERSENAESQHLQLSISPNERCLGMEWLIQEDGIRFSDMTPKAPPTRRGLLSTVASLYDPLGLLAPFILQGKLILQEACKKGTKWDETIEESLLERWQNWTKELQQLEKIQVQRCYHPPNFGKIVKTQLHHFSDASTKGYGTCSYLRFENEEGRVHCALVAGKSRVAPTKAVSIPRMELTAAVLAARVGTNVRDLLQMNIDQEYYWTDSNIVLAYINNEAKRFHTFVANRVQKINDITQTSDWHHVSTSGNPADHASRGLTLSQLPDSSWLKGPEWLWQPTFEIPTYATTTLSQHDPEVRISLLCQTSSQTYDMDERLSHISKWTRARRVVARILRLADRERTKDANITPDELMRATRAITSSVQKQFFQEDWHRVSKGQSIKSSSPLSITEPFLHNGVLRAKGRIKSPLTPLEEKHPIILPRCHTSSLIISHAHDKTMHQGRGITMNEIRTQGYWIMGASKQTAALIKNCAICRRLRGNPAEQLMGELPDERTEPSPPFTNVGMDCFGPITVKNGRKEIKRYGLLFTCMCTRGVHVEMIDDLSTDCFINGLRCFMAIRGPVRKIFCDQGTNFIGANNEFKKSLEAKLQLKMEECEFVFNPPHAPHCGGVWERQVKTVKSILTAITALNPGRLDDSSLRTFLYEAMSIVNSRPITFVHQGDPLSPEALTPNHVITMKTNQLLPPPGPYQEEDVFLQKRWRRVQYLLQQFWSRWRREYLAELSKRQKWRTPRRNMRVGDVVLLKEDNTPRNQWPLAIVTETTAGKDGLVRKVMIQVSTNKLDKKGKRMQEPAKLERPIQKLVLVQASEDLQKL